jgi:RNA polymerase sigma factor (sigma-70 family)
MMINTKQWNSIRSILNNPSTTYEMKNEINMQLFNYYKKWAIQKAYNFKIENQILCKQIKLDELNLYALNGLVKSIENYNSTYIFKNYALTYINSALYDGITKLHPITSVPGYIRKNKNHKWRLSNKTKYYKMIKPVLIGHDFYKIENHMIDNNENNPHKILMNKNEWLHMWSIIEENLDANSLKVFKYKYDFEFAEVRSNKLIGELMCCSEETIRQNLLKSKMILKNKIIE